MNRMIKYILDILGADVCQPNEISCKDPSRGRKCVQKFWMCDGDR
jgi:hypothetical protein